MPSVKQSAQDYTAVASGLPIGFKVVRMPAMLGGMVSIMGVLGTILHINVKTSVVELGGWFQLVTSTAIQDIVFVVVIKIN